MNAKEFYKKMYGEDAPKKFDEMEAETLFDFAEAYAQMRAGENSISQHISNNAVAVCPKCGAEETAFDVFLDKSKCMICQYTW